MSTFANVTAAEPSLCWMRRCSPQNRAHGIFGTDSAEGALKSVATQIRRLPCEQPRCSALVRTNACVWPKPFKTVIGRCWSRLPRRGFSWPIAFRRTRPLRHSPRTKTRYTKSPEAGFHSPGQREVQRENAKNPAHRCAGFFHSRTKVVNSLEASRRSTATHR